jgi:hypothetical protein
MSLYVLVTFFEPYIEIWKIVKIFLNILLILVICFQKIVELEQKVSHQCEISNKEKRLLQLLVNLIYR